MHFDSKTFSKASLTHWSCIDLSANLYSIVRWPDVAPSNFLSVFTASIIVNLSYLPGFKPGLISLVESNITIISGLGSDYTLQDVYVTVLFLTEINLKNKKSTESQLIQTPVLNIIKSQSQT